MVHHRLLRVAGVSRRGRRWRHGFNNAFNNNNSNNNGGPAGDSLRHGYHQARDFVLDNLDWIIPVAAAAMILLLALWLVILWLSSRGNFMFLHCVALDKAEVGEPWNKFGREANSLFWFRLGLGLIGMVLMLPMLAAIAVHDCADGFARRTGRGGHHDGGGSCD